jgi:ATP-dependent RNA helicase
MSRKEKNDSMDAFRSGSSRVLVTSGFVATDNRASLLINLEVPLSREVYLRRVNSLGKDTGKVNVITLMSKDEMDLLPQLQTITDGKLEILPKNPSDLF